MGEHDENISQHPPQTKTVTEVDLLDRSSCFSMHSRSGISQLSSMGSTFGCNPPAIFLNSSESVGSQIDSDNVQDKTMKLVETGIP